ncbi:type I-E CRISPR-associated protein Cas7/Cse4/CasC [Desulfolutivibrio sulfoxidireducens]|uniref:type I-E CRISPR-associated protein Cas7/Cse4/CasC n=1 Tax=Desulfolutivibrio sulfoxidireducens TaxID=2773299 RepID=UPI00159D3EEE|nr:type I-E CRISPR-associated protein Cas7/Cse4/CasC [Desulfolutivibrio sulfoxidireducens]QLA20889.1 type I-E CRISPR-associated protein Cas7/Cse4/CasC [Desulfolutivibrio sulfoxidireducens]
MTTGRFLQLHILTSYPPANLNRDDLGRPKTAIFGGSTRLRVSSQCLKRTWRTSDVFCQALTGHVGTRTKIMGKYVYAALVLGKPLAEVLAEPVFPLGKQSFEALDKKALEKARVLAGFFGKCKSRPDKKEDRENNPLAEVEIEQLAHFGPEELAALEKAVEAARTADAVDPAGLSLLQRKLTAVDIGMFGRMLAADPAFNVDAAVQVAHAISINAVTVDEDYFTAVDDLNRHEEDAGAGHIGVTEFGAGIFYQYVCVNRDLLAENLENDTALAQKALRTLVEAAVSVAPSGKQNSFASRAFASYVLAETGDRQPRTLAAAFLDPVAGGGMIAQGVDRLRQTMGKFDTVYGPCAKNRYEFDVESASGTLSGLLDFVVG